VDKKYLLGIEIIDKQHQKIFDLITQLSEVNINRENLMKIIQELKDYSIYHFETEEKYFDDLGFKYSSEHKILHNIFIETIDFYFVNPQKIKKEKLHTFLITWIDNHILEEDLKYTLKENITV